MKVKVFYPNSKGQIIFTKEELEKLLDEVYEAGYADGRKQSWTWTSPSYPWYYTYTANTTTGTPLNITNASNDNIVYTHKTDDNNNVTTSISSEAPLTIDLSNFKNIKLSDEICINNNAKN